MPEQSVLDNLASAFLALLGVDGNVLFAALLGHCWSVRRAIG